MVVEYKVYSNVMRYIKWNQEEIQYLISNYGVKTLQEIADHLRRKRNGVKTKVKKLGLRGSKLTSSFNLNHNFFDIPNVFNSYYAGFIAADGNVQERVLSISQCDKNKEILYSFARDIEFEGVIKGPYKQSYGYSKNKESIYYQLSFTSPNCIVSLKKNFSITKNKTYTLRPPKIKNIEYIIAFCAGLIDGDGYIGIINNYPVICFSGTEELLQWVDINLQSILPKSQRKHGFKVRQIGNKRCFELRIGGHRACKLHELVKELKLPVLNWKWSRLDNNYYLKNQRKVRVVKSKL